MDEQQGRRAKTERRGGRRSARNRAFAQAVQRGEGESGGREGWWYWWSTGKRPVLRFVVALVVFLAVFNYVYYVAFVRGDLLRPHLETTTMLTGAILRGLGTDVLVSGTSISSPRFSMNVDNGCDALQPLAFYVFAVLASPVQVSVLLRAASIVVGGLLLVATNLVRLTSLYYVGIYRPAAFDVVHIEVWQTAFVFLPIFLWLFWVWWVLRRRGEPGNVVA